MPLKHSYAKKEEIPQGQESLYVERNGAFVLDAEPHPDSQRLAEFRENNRKLHDESKELKEKLAKIKDPELAAKLLADHEKAIEDLAKKAGDVDKLVEQRLTAFRQETDKKIGALSVENSQQRERLEQLLVDNAVTSVALPKGVSKTAIPDVVTRAKLTFKVVDGKAVAVKPGTDEKLYGKTGDPLSIEEWLETLAAEAPHLFEASRGTGSAGGTGTSSTGAAAGAKNPWKKETWNLTQQMLVTKQNPVQAQRMKAEAGAK